MTAILQDTQLLKGRALGRQFVRENATQSSVSVPPALIITASDGATFTLGHRCREHDNGMMEFNVAMNDRDTGEFATNIEYRDSKVRIYGRDGWRVWTGKGFI